MTRDGNRAVLLTYGDAYEYERQPEEAWAATFGRTPRHWILPVREQGEAVCYDAKGEALYLTSEIAPGSREGAPLFEVRRGAGGE